MAPLAPTQCDRFVASSRNLVPPMTILEKAVISIVDQYRDGAEDFAKRMAWRLTKSGDHKNAAYWREIIQAISELERESPAA